VVCFPLHLFILSTSKSCSFNLPCFFVNHSFHVYSRSSFLFCTPTLVSTFAFAHFLLSLFVASIVSSYHPVVIPLQERHSFARTLSTMRRQSGPGLVVCAGCHKSYKRLSTHITQNAACAMHYTTNDTAHNTPPLATIHNTCLNGSVTSNVPTTSRFSSSVQAVDRNISSSRERNKMTYI
jgi:hypothetical protein